MLHHFYTESTELLEKAIVGDHQTIDTNVISSEEKDVLNEKTSLKPAGV